MIGAVFYFIVAGGDTLHVTSKSFKNGEFIPVKYTCDGKNISPHVKWTPGPKGTRSYALIMWDPDAPGGTFYHWILYDIPASVTELKEGQRIGKVGRNDFGKVRYDGPCPPPGSSPHRYYITVYAVSVRHLGVRPGSRADRVLRAMSGRVVARGEIMGYYKRKRSRGLKLR